MKVMRHVYLLTIAVVLFAISCTKSDETPTSISGKWNIVTDSFYVGAGITNHQVIYAGQPGDYFDFRDDGYIYVLENSVADTLRYTFSSNTLVVEDFGSGEGKARLQSPSTRQLTISSTYIYTPGGAVGRSVSLAR